SRTLAANLDDAGFQAQVFTSGTAALAYFDGGGRADAVLLDWRMRDLNGAQVLAALRNRNLAIPGLVLSGDPQPTLRQQAAALGASGVLDKTRSFDAIVEHLERVLPGGGPQRA